LQILFIDMDPFYSCVMSTISFKTSAFNDPFSNTMDQVWKQQHWKTTENKTTENWTVECE